MELLSRLILIAGLFLFSGCAALQSGEAPNFADGTWSKCSYLKDGRSIVLPLQLGGAPLEWTEPDGTSVKCAAIPKEVVNEPTPKAGE